MCFVRTKSATVSATLLPFKRTTFAPRLSAKRKLAGYGVLVGLFGAELTVDVNYVQFGIHTARHSCTTGYEILSRGFDEMQTAMRSRTPQFLRISCASI